MRNQCKVQRVKNDYKKIEPSLFFANHLKLETERHEKLTKTATSSGHFCLRTLRKVLSLVFNPWMLPIQIRSTQNQVKCIFSLENIIADSSLQQLVIYNRCMVAAPAENFLFPNIYWGWGVIMKWNMLLGDPDFEVYTTFLYRRAVNEVMLFFLPSDNQVCTTHSNPENHSIFMPILWL